MVCRNGQQFDDAEFLKAFSAAVRENRVPLHGSLELTYRCNLKCVHCYAKPGKACKGDRRRELSTARIMSLLDELAEAGCLFLLLTGGEPLLHKGFSKIYRKAKELGIFVTVFTNGTLLDGRTLDLFTQLPPLVVELSLYGASPATHERVTGIKGSFAATMKAVDRLVARGIKVTLKTVGMTLNRSEIRKMERMAKGRGLKFRFDASIFPRLDGDHWPLDLRLGPDEASKIEFADKIRAASWRKYSVRPAGKQDAESKLYTCGAGISCFHVDAYGRLFPCLMARSSGYDLVKGSFSEGWTNHVPEIRKVVAPPGYRCNSCEKRSFCSTCPAAFSLESGAAEIYYSFNCGMATNREKLLSRKP